MSIASFVSWRWLAVAIASATLLVLNAVHLRFPSRWPKVYWALVLIPATMTAIAWVTGGPVRIPTVEVTPASKTPLLRIFTNEADCRESPPGQAIRGGAFISLTEHGCEKPLACGTTYAVLEGKWVPLAEDNGCERPNVLRESAVVRRLRDLCDVPYFGESENLIYVGSITNVLQTERRSCRWDAGPLVELRREDVLLSFRRGRGFLGGSRERPIRPPLARMKPRSAA